MGRLDGGGGGGASRQRLRNHQMSHWTLSRSGPQLAPRHGRLGRVPGELQAQLRPGFGSPPASARNEEPGRRRNRRQPPE